MSLDNEAVKLAYLRKSNARAVKTQLNKSEPDLLDGKGMSAYGSRTVGGKKGKENMKLAVMENLVEDAPPAKKQVKRLQGGKKEMRSKAEKMGEEYGREIMAQDEEAKKLVGAGFWKDFAKGLKKGVQIVAPMVNPVAGTALSAGLSLIGDGQARGQAEKRRAGIDAQGADMGKVKGGKKSKATKTPKSNDKRKARGQLISKLMREKGMSLAEASRYIKQQGLM